MPLQNVAFSGDNAPSFEENAKRPCPSALQTISKWQPQSAAEWDRILSVQDSFKDEHGLWGLPKNRMVGRSGNSDQQDKKFFRRRIR